MNSIVLFALVALCATSALSSPIQEPRGACKSQSEKPTLGPNDNVKPGDDYMTRFSKMFKGYIQQEKDGKVEYLPLNLKTTYGIDHGESLTKLSEPHYWDETLITDCANIELLVTKTRPSVSVHYGFKNMDYSFDGSQKNCTITSMDEQEKGVHTFSCVDASKATSTLVIQRLDMDKFLPTILPKSYDVVWDEV